MPHGRAGRTSLPRPSLPASRRSGLASTLGGIHAPGSALWAGLPASPYCISPGVSAWEWQQPLALLAEPNHILQGNVSVQNAVQNYFDQ